MAVAVFATGGRLQAEPRREWKEQAIATIERRLSDRQDLQSEIDSIAKTLSTTRPAPGSWVGQDVLVMKNGEWIAFDNICSKEDSRIHDLFIGHGSDGKWYYSTFHFCRDMTTLRVMQEWQPDSLAQFARAYWLTQFDGRSNEALKTTWTSGDPYAEERLELTSTTNPVRRTAAGAPVLREGSGDPMKLGVRVGRHATTTPFR